MRYSIRDNIRIAQTRNASTEDIVVVDNRTDDKYMINRAMYDVIRHINEGDIPVAELSNVLNKKFNFTPKALGGTIDYLSKEKIIIPTEKRCGI